MAKIVQQVAKICGDLFQCRFSLAGSLYPARSAQRASALLPAEVGPIVSSLFYLKDKGVPCFKKNALDLHRFRGPYNTVRSWAKSRPRAILACIADAPSDMLHEVDGSQEQLASAERSLHLAMRLCDLLPESAEFTFVLNDLRPSNIMVHFSPRLIECSDLTTDRSGRP
jgi:hypothetical protein